MKVGDIAIVFDPLLWDGKDSEDDDFYREATILDIYKEDNVTIANVKFHHDGRISRRHFVSLMKGAKR
jgi:hypothetical protein